MTVTEMDAQFGRVVRELEDTERLVGRLQIRAIELATQHEQAARLLRVSASEAAAALQDREVGISFVRLQPGLLSAEAIVALSIETEECSARLADLRKQRALLK